MPDCLANRSCPERHDRYAATVAAFDFLTHDILLRRSALQLENIILAPIVARSLERPHIVWLRTSISLLRAESMLLHQHLVDLKVGVSIILIARTHQRDVGKVVVRLQN